MVTIKIKGTGPILYIADSDDENVLEYNAIMQGIEVYANDEDITKKKGKYIKGRFITEDMKKVFGEDFENEDILYKCVSSLPEFTKEYELPIEISDFDPKKLQLKKSDYEFSEFPYLIMTDEIIYDGVPYDTISEPEDYWMETFDDITKV